jgi:hypothetical protein
MISNIATFVFFQFFICSQCSLNILYYRCKFTQYVGSIYADAGATVEKQKHFLRQFYFNYKPMYL